jgi:hypothetical protein
MALGRFGVLALWRLDALAVGRLDVDQDPEEGGEGGLVRDELGEKEVQVTATQPCLTRIQKEEVTKVRPG